MQNTVKIQFGCGANHLEGWRNHDQDVDIRKPLPYSTHSADFVFAEHVMEHITPGEALKFLEECRRILKPGGVLRVCVPGIDRVFYGRSKHYDQVIEALGLGKAGHLNSCRAVILEHGHLGLYTRELLKIVLSIAGFSQVIECSPRMSEHIELNGIDSHCKTVGNEANDFETIICEATK